MPRRERNGAATEFGLRVRQRRTQLKLSQEQLAERSEHHWTYISSVERGERNVTLNTILRLAKALEVDPSELVLSLQP
jgi:transcriptional regulator with XRE-family HTH domain